MACPQPMIALEMCRRVKVEPRRGGRFPGLSHFGLSHPHWALSQERIQLDSISSHLLTRRLSTRFVLLQPESSVACVTFTWSPRSPPWVCSGRLWHLAVPAPSPTWAAAPVEKTSPAASLCRYSPSLYPRGLPKPRVLMCVRYAFVPSSPKGRFTTSTW